MYCLFSDEVTYQLAEKRAEIHVSNSIAEFPGSPLFGLLGEPNLPVDNITLLLPPDADLSTVSVSIKHSRFVDIQGKFDINPRYPLRTTDGDIETDVRKRIVNDCDIEIYSSNSFFPKNCIRSVQVGQLEIISC